MSISEAHKKELLEQKFEVRVYMSGLEFGSSESRRRWLQDYYVNFDDQLPEEDDFEDEPTSMTLKDAIKVIELYRNATGLLVDVADEIESLEYPNDNT
jgi:hypothetical protein